VQCFKQQTARFVARPGDTEGNQIASSSTPGANGAEDADIKAFFRAAGGHRSTAASTWCWDLVAVVLILPAAMVGAGPRDCSRSETGQYVAVRRPDHSQAAGSGSLGDTESGTPDAQPGRRARVNYRFG